MLGTEGPTPNVALGPTTIATPVVRPPHDHTSVGRGGRDGRLPGGPRGHPPDPQSCAVPGGPRVSVSTTIRMCLSVVTLWSPVSAV